jgi:hypothetical protein
VRSDRQAPLGNGSLLPGSAACGGPWNQAVRAPDVTLGSPSRRLKKAEEPRTGSSDWWSETETCTRHLDQVGSPGVFSIRSQRGLMLLRGPAEP